MTGCENSAGAIKVRSVRREASRLEWAIAAQEGSGPAASRSESRQPNSLERLPAGLAALPGPGMRTAGRTTTESTSAALRFGAGFIHI
jgi:hypothetical protein